MRRECLTCDCTFSGGCRAEVSSVTDSLRQRKSRTRPQFEYKGPPPPGFVGIWPNAKGHKIRYPRPHPGTGYGFRQRMREAKGERKKDKGRNGREDEIRAFGVVCAGKFDVSRGINCFARSNGQRKIGMDIDGYRIIQGDCLDVLRSMESESVQCCVTSPPYFGLRDYGTASWDGGDADCDHKGVPMRTRAKINANTGNGDTDKKNAEGREFFKSECGKCGAVRVDKQIGLEPTPAEFVAKMVEVFKEVRRVLKKDGTLWLNLGDSYWTDSPVRKSAKEAFSDTWDKSQTATNGGLRKTAKAFGPWKNKDLIGIPWRVAFALQEAGWWLRQDIIWSKPNPMPESVTDRCTKAHEYLFLLTKSAKYFYDAEAVKEPSTEKNWESRLERQSIKSVPTVQHNGIRGRTGANAFRGQGHFRDGDNGPANREGRDMKEVGAGETRNKRSVWTVTTQPYSEAHFATFPPKLIEPCILAGSREGDLVLDPFSGSGTTGLVSLRHRRNFVGIELNPEYIKIAENRLSDVQVKLF